MGVPIRHTLTTNHATAPTAGDRSTFPLQFLRVNLNANARTETLNGREYLVVPARMIVPGVLPGSKGPLYYPPEEVAKNVGDWNGMPIVLRHPTLKLKDGSTVNVSARDPSILSESGMGYVFRSKADNVGDPLDAEAWFDVQNTERLDKTLASQFQVLPRLRANKPIELSTGLFTQDEAVPDGTAHNGVAYNYIARNYRPDHLAVLPDEVGACGVRDGCGLNVNQDTEAGVFQRFWDWLKGNTHPTPPNLSNNSSTEDTDMNRNTLVSWITANCDCYKGKTNLLNDPKNFSDDELKKLKANAELLTTNSKTANQAVMVARAKWVTKNSYIINTPSDTAAPAGINVGELAKFFEVTTDPASDPAGFIKELLSKLKEVETKLAGATIDDPEDVQDLGADEATEGATEAPKTMKKVPQPAANNGGIDMVQLAKLIRTEVSNAIGTTFGDQIQGQKDQLIGAILANEIDPEQKTIKFNKLKTKTVAELKELVSLLPISHINNVNPLIGQFGGTYVDPAGQPLHTLNTAGQGGTDTQTQVDNDDDFNSPVINWKEEAKNNRRQRQSA